MKKRILENGIPMNRSRLAFKGKYLSDKTKIEDLLTKKDKQKLPIFKMHN